MRIRRRIAAGMLMALCVAFSPARSTGGVPPNRADSSQASEPDLPPGVERVTSVEGITEYRLSNGLRVLLFPDPSKQTITVNITYLVGSLHENYGETGMAHLLEHLLFKGSPRHPDIPQELTEHGSRPNGTTSFDRTNYYETFQANEENLRWALDLEADRMIHSFIARKDLDTEFTVVRNEFEAGENNPFMALWKRVSAAAFEWHNYGKDTIGERSDIENVSIDRLQAFYKKYYQPDNAVLMITGQIDEAKALALVHEHFAQIPRPSRTLSNTYTTEPTQDGERFVTVRRVGDVQAILAAHHAPAGSHPDFAAIEVLTTVLGDTPSGRLHKALVETGKCVLVANMDQGSHDPNVSLLFAIAQKDVDLGDARDTMLGVIDKLSRNPPTTEEINRARVKLLKQIELDLGEADRIGHVMSEYMAQGDWRLYFLRRDRIREVTPADVIRVASHYFKPSNRTVGVFIPTNEPDRSVIPPRPNVVEMVKEYRGQAPASLGEAFDPSIENIESRARRLTTPGGMKLALVPKKTRGSKVFARLTLHFGNEAALVNRGDSGEFVAYMLLRGTDQLTREQIQDRFDQLKAHVHMHGGADEASALIETTRENLPGVLRHLAHSIRGASFPVGEFEQVKREEISFLEYQSREPEDLASIALEHHLTSYPKGHPRYAGTIAERMADCRSVTLEDVRAFYRDFYGADRAELAVVGDFDDQEVLKLAHELFDGWKCRIPYERVPESFREVPAVHEVIETLDKANSMFVAGMNLDVRDDHPDYPALLLGNYLLGGGFLNSRLAVRIRQKDGLSYGVGSDLAISSSDRSGQFTAYAICAPENVAKVEAAMTEEIERVLRHGFSAGEVMAGKSGWLKRRQVSRAQDRELAARLGRALFLGRTLAWEGDLEKRIETLDPDQVTEAVRRHLDPRKLVRVKSGDFGRVRKEDKGTK